MKTLSPLGQNVESAVSHFIGYMYLFIGYNVLDLLLLLCTGQFLDFELWAQLSDSLLLLYNNCDHSIWSISHEN